MDMRKPCITAVKKIHTYYRTDYIYLGKLYSGFKQPGYLLLSRFNNMSKTTLK